MSNAIAWAKSHRALFGWLLAFITGGLGSTGHTQAAAILAPASTLLLGAGHFESDAAKQGK